MLFSLSRERRERELLRITKENQDILKRIMSKKPEETSSTRYLRKDWDQNVKFLNNISAFPEDWYKRDTTNIYSTRSGVNTNRPKLGERSQTDNNISSSNDKSNLNQSKTAPSKDVNQKKYEDEFEKDD